MKKLLIILSLSLGVTYLHGQEFYMYVGGQKCVFEVSPTKMLVKAETLTAASVKEDNKRINY